MTISPRLPLAALLAAPVAAAMLIVGLWANPIHAQLALGQPGMPYLVAETGQRFNKLQDAVAAIGSGVGTIRIAPGHYADCAVQVAGDVSFVAEMPGETVLETATCEGKAGLVLRGRSSHVTGLVFNHFKMSDGNGAGIRLEKGNLTVSQSWFHDSEEGILADNDPNGSVSVDRSTFTHLGRCDRGISCAHAIYINFYDRVTVTNNRFEAGDGGHYLKVRAGHVDVRDNSFDDTAGRRTNYMIDLPAGSTGWVAGNLFIQGRAKENGSALIAVAAESRDHKSDGLTIEGNIARLAPGAARGPVFVADWSGDRIVVGANQLGDGIVRFQRR